MMKTPKQWAEENGIDDQEALDRIKWAMQIFGGFIVSVTLVTGKKFT